MNSEAEVVLLTAFACEETSFKDLPSQGFCQLSLPFHAKNQFILLLVLNKCRDSLAACGSCWQLPFNVKDNL